MKDSQSTTSSILSFFRARSMMFILLGLCLFLSFSTTTFLTKQNLINVLIQISINALIAAGMTFVIISGGIDLSVGSIAAFAGIVATAVIVRMPDISVFGAVLISLGVSVLVGIVVGGFTGIAVSRLNVPPFIATLAMMSIARGFTLVYTQSRSIYGLPSTFSWIGQEYIGFIPVIVLVMIIVLVISYLLLERSVFGTHVYATGSNEEVAKLCGVNVKRIQLLVYIICGIFSSFAGVCLASRLVTGQPSAATGYELNAIAAVFLGGTSTKGGKGSIGQTILGLLTIGVINNGLNLLRVSSYWQSITMGVIILAAIVIDQYKKE